MRTLTKRLTRRKHRVSKNIRGTSDVLRISLHRSNKFMYAQAIDDVARKTIASANTVALEQSNAQTKSESAKACGLLLAKALKQLQKEKAVIDRGRFQYMGRVARFVEGLREGGIQV